MTAGYTDELDRGVWARGDSFSIIFASVRANVFARASLRRSKHRALLAYFQSSVRETP